MTDHLDGHGLRAWRERLGLSVGEVARATGVQANYVRALEEGRRTSLPSGPYAKAYADQIRALLVRVEAQGADALDRRIRPSWPLEQQGGEATTPPPEVHVEAVPEPEAPRIPWPVMRRLTHVLVAAMVVLLVADGVLALRTLGARSAPAGGDEVLVEVTLKRNVPLTVWIDGELTVRRTYAGGSEAAFAGRREVRMLVPRMQDVAVTFNDQELKPAGDERQERLLTFRSADGGTW